jgi:hypothetical protein
VLLYETPSSTEWGIPAVQGSFPPRGLRRHHRHPRDQDRVVSEVPERGSSGAPSRSPESLRARARTWGSVIGTDAAEVFQVVRAIR